MTEVDVLEKKIGNVRGTASRESACNCVTFGVISGDRDPLVFRTGYRERTKEIDAYTKKWFGGYVHRFEKACWGCHRLFTALAEVARGHLTPYREINARLEVAMTHTVVGSGNCEVACSGYVMKLLENVRAQSFRKDRKQLWTLGADVEAMEDPIA